MKLDQGISPWGQQPPRPSAQSKGYISVIQPRKFDSVSSSFAAVSKMNAARPVIMSEKKKQMKPKPKCCHSNPFIPVKEVLPKEPNSLEK